MGRPIETHNQAEPAEAPLAVAEGVTFTINEEGEKVLIEIGLEESFTLTQEMSEAIKTMSIDKEEAIMEGVSCAAEVMILMMTGTAITKPIEATITDADGNKYKLTFEKQ